MLRITFLAGFGAVVMLGSAANAQDICKGFGPQTPRDISSPAGANPLTFEAAPAASSMNLCNIHFHAQAEHKGPGFAVFAGATDDGGYRCNGTDALTAAEKAAFDGHRCHGVKPGDTVEVHWVHTSCDADPGPSLGACVTPACANPQLRVETAVFLVVNDRAATQFQDFAYDGNVVGGLHQARALPSGQGVPVTFGGSTTGTKYTQEKCSPYQVSWSVRPQCQKLDIASLDAWCGDNVFKEDHAHGVRQLVTAPELLSSIE